MPHKSHPPSPISRGDPPSVRSAFTPPLTSPDGKKVEMLSSLLRAGCGWVSALLNVTPGKRNREVMRVSCSSEGYNKSKKTFFFLAQTKGKPIVEQIIDHWFIYGVVLVQRYCNVGRKENVFPSFIKKYYHYKSLFSSLSFPSGQLLCPS